MLKHENSFKYIHNAVNLLLLSEIDIKYQIDSNYKLSTQRHNELVNKNRYILDRIINCITFCRKYELLLQGHNEKYPQIIRRVFVDLSIYLRI